jgi:hypothetical protein
MAAKPSTAEMAKKATINLWNSTGAAESYKVVPTAGMIAETTWQSNANGGNEQKSNTVTKTTILN